MTNASFDLTGRVAVVTGGSRGLGRAIAEGFAAAGADIVVASRKIESCEQAAQHISAATGRLIQPVAWHVGRWHDCDGLIDATIARFGRIDILVNNAGMSPLYESLDSVTIGSLLASPHELPYACAKAGLNALTVGLAEAYAPAIRVNAVLPGPFATDVTRGWSEEMKSGLCTPEADR